MIIIGIVGQASSGKDTVSKHIAEKGFLHISLGDLLREEMRRQGLTALDRPQVREFAVAQRQQFGAFYPANIAAERALGMTVISGMRNTSEVDYLKAKFAGAFHLIAVIAPLETRYQRIIERNREGDNISFEQFKIQEEAERDNNPETHEVDNVIAMAEYTIENSGSLQDLFEKIDGCIAGLS